MALRSALAGDRVGGRCGRWDETASASATPWTDTRAARKPDTRDDHQPHDQQDRQPDDQEPDPGARHGLEDGHQARGSLVDRGRRLPFPGSLLNRNDRGIEERGQGRIGGLVAQTLELCGELLDLASDVGESGLHLEDIGDLRGLRGNALEGGFAGPEIPDPRLEIDDLRRDFDCLGLLGDDLDGALFDE